MTTKVLVVCPDHSTHDVLVVVIKDGADIEQHVVAPTEQSPPIYVDEDTRISVTEVGRERAEPKK